MRANELMIGDFVMFTSKYGYGIGQIGGIEAREGSAEPTTFTIRKKDKNGNTILFVGVSRTCVQPITLTPEILKKNDFVSTQFYSELVVGNTWEHYQIQWDGYRLRAKKLGIGELDIPCKYVHELQHALRLCGIEIEITL